MRTTEQLTPHYNRHDNDYEVYYTEGSCNHIYYSDSREEAQSFIDEIRAEMNSAQLSPQPVTEDMKALQEISKPATVTTPTPSAFAIDTDIILASIGNVLKEKNKRYGNSALNPVNIFTGKSKVGQRLDDKLSRVQNNATLQKNDVCDLIGYLMLVCHENGWKDFADQID